MPCLASAAADLLHCATSSAMSVRQYIPTSAFGLIALILAATAQVPSSMVVDLFFGQPEPVVIIDG